MMNIIVCLNFLPDANIVTLDPEAGRIDSEDLVYTVHPSDLVAVEAAVRLKEEHGPGKVFLAAMSSPSGERLLRRCLSLGADEAILINGPNHKNQDGYSIGAILAGYCRTLDFDLILCGQGSLDHLGGQTGYVLAELLNLPVVARVTKFELLSGETEAALEKKLERGYREKLELTLPAVLMIEESLNEPRYPGLPGMLNALEKEIRKMTMEDLNFSSAEKDLARPKLELLRMKIPKPRPKKIFTPDTSLSAADRMFQIMSGGMEEKNKELFEGTPDELSSKFIDYLNQIDIRPDRK